MKRSLKDSSYWSWPAASHDGWAVWSDW